MTVITVYTKEGLAVRNKLAKSLFGKEFKFCGEKQKMNIERMLKLVKKL